VVPPAAVIAAGTPLVAAPSVVETGAADASVPEVEPDELVEPVLQAERRAAAVAAEAATAILRRAFMRNRPLRWGERNPGERAVRPPRWRLAGRNCERKHPRASYVLSRAGYVGVTGS
jgi:hypothetical protein